MKIHEAQNEQSKLPPEKPPEPTTYQITRDLSIKLWPLQVEVTVKDIYTGSAVAAVLFRHEALKLFKLLGVWGEAGDSKESEP